jgi:hypothetical protein
VITKQKMILVLLNNGEGKENVNYEDPNAHSGQSRVVFVVDWRHFRWYRELHSQRRILAIWPPYSDNWLFAIHIIIDYDGKKEKTKTNKKITNRLN